MLTLDGICRQLDQFRNDPGLLQPRNLADRQEAFDFFTAARAFIQHSSAGRFEGEITRQIARLEGRYQKINRELFDNIRKDIRSGYLSGSDIRIIFNDYTAYHPGQIGKDHVTTDDLDILLNGLFEISELPHAVLPRDSGMIHLEIAPASVILDMIDHAGLTGSDVFYDLGSGLGQPAMLVNLLCGARCVGIEYQPNFHQFACDRLEMLSLEDVSYFNEDARDADLSEGTVFFLFSPFKGSILDQVLDKLHGEALDRQIRICTFGSCVNPIGQLDWLRLIYPGEPGEYKLVVFESV